MRARGAAVASRRRFGKLTPAAPHAPTPRGTHGLGASDREQRDHGGQAAPSWLAVRPGASPSSQRSGYGFPKTLERTRIEMAPTSYGASRT